jgi:microcin C transport system permease protein
MLILANAVFAWISLSYYVRAEILKIRKQAFVDAAKALGCKHKRILWTHIIPNSFTPIITFAPFIVNLAINNLAVLDYLGLGVQPPTASIGELLRQGRSHFTSAWWLAVYPFAALVTTIVMINFIGEGVREAFDPRQARR